MRFLTTAQRLGLLTSLLLAFGILHILQCREIEELQTTISWPSSALKDALQHYWQTSTSYIIQTSPAFCERRIHISNTLPTWSHIAHNVYYEAPEINLEPFLNGDVHPIFKVSNWLSDLPQMTQAYQAMLPALRLATEFLTHDEFLDWWLHVQFSKIAQDAHTGHHYLQRLQVIEDVDHLKRQVKQELLRFANRVRFTWQDSDSLGGNVLAETTMRRWYQPQLEADEPRIIMIAFRAGFYCRLLAAYGQGTSQSQELRFQLSLASTLLHELAHAWHLHHHAVGRKWKTNGGLEPLMNPSDVVPEMGYSIQIALFGGLLECQDYVEPDGWMPCVGPMQSSRLEDLFPVVVPAYTYVPMWWVQQWFLTDTWDRVEQLQSLGQLRVPTIDDHGTFLHLGRFVDGIWYAWLYEHEPWLHLYSDGSKGSVPKDSKWPWNCTDVATCYLPVWEKEAAEAYRTGQLPAQYYQPRDRFKHFFRDYKFPFGAK